MPTKATAKAGPKSVMPSSKGSNPVSNSGGNPGRVLPQKPIPGPSGKGGLPISMRKALKK